LIVLPGPLFFLVRADEIQSSEPEGRQKEEKTFGMPEGVQGTCMSYLVGCTTSASVRSSEPGGWARIRRQVGFGVVCLCLPSISRRGKGI
jgi:hypothetical protein